MDHKVASDRISDLPWQLLDNILGRLPIENVVDSTTLSSKWKDKWVDVSNLLFYDSRGVGSKDSRLFAKYVYRVLLSHRSTIRKFEFTSDRSVYSFSAIDLETWVSFLSRHGIEELSFHFSSSSPCPSHFLSSVFSCDLLRHLNLNNCWASIPERFSGFRNLVSLQLTCFKYDCNQILLLETLIKNCPILEKLVLLEISVSSSFTIYARNLKYLSVKGDLNDIYVSYSPHLSDASLHRTTKADKLEGMSHNLVQPPDWLSQTRRLVLNGHFLKFLAQRYTWCGIACHNLEVLELDEVHFDDLDEIRVALSILEICSSNLKILHGCEPFHDKDVRSFTEALSDGKYCFEQLRVVSIRFLLTHDGSRNLWYYDDDIRKIKYQDMSFLGIIKLVLACSPILEKVRVCYGTKCGDFGIWLMRELLLCERASSQLKLTFF